MTERIPSLAKRSEAPNRALERPAPNAPPLSATITIQIQSPESEEKVQVLYRAWLDRCPVYLALTKPLTVKTTLARSV